MTTETVENLVIVFTIPLKIKVNFRTQLPDLSLARTPETPLSSLYCHLEEHLNLGTKDALSLLPIAVCRSTNSQLSTKLPLVSEHMWRYLLDKYPYNNVRVVVEKRPSIDLTSPLGCAYLFRKELKVLDLSYYLPKVLEKRHLVYLSEDILHLDYHIKPKLRRGLWMHLLGVFHPALKTLEQREVYIQSLRRVYDNLKGRLGDATNWSPQVHHLRESIQRDAVRTDPSEAFLAVPSTMQKLVDIVTIYTLEHSEIKYTQGMTDLLSPILYVMEREDDAYICFSAMFERIKVNFTEWCEGTLNKLERLKHLCEVLDPELYRYLSQQQQHEDPFVLFFGMVLIECRREFSFQDGLHLLEVLWAAALRKDAPSLESVSRAKWASFMTSVSTEIVFQAFGEVEAPYSTHPLHDSLEVVVNPRRETSKRSTPRSSAKRIPRSGSASTRSKERCEAGSVPSSPTLVISEFSPQHPIKRSMSLPDNNYAVINNDCVQSHGVKSEGDLCKGVEDECEDFLSELDLKIQCIPQTTEMADMSSVSSATTTNGHCLRNSAGENVTSMELSQQLKNHEGSEVRMKPIDNDVFLHGSLEMDNTEVEKNDTGEKKALEHESQNENNLKEGELKSALPRGHGNQRKVQTLPRGRRSTTSIARGDEEDLPRSTTLPRNHSTLPPAAFLHHLSRPSLSSPYVSSIRALDPRIDYPNTNTDPFGEDSRSTSPHSPLRISPFSISPCHSRNSPVSYPSPLPSISQVREVTSNHTMPLSMEGSLEVSQVISELMSAERDHPDVNWESSLRIKMADAFSLFICLAILVKNRHSILTERMDFISLSMMLNTQAESQSLPQILKIARQLHRVYYSYQMTYYDVAAQKDAKMFETWLDDPSFVIGTTES